ncbi:hypothetical protein TrVFT333_003579 [Trichoderma virens FT-333]|nr:hypothetical protein TrVFT333_003579 [Trichoderma virens FT-333]
MPNSPKFHTRAGSRASLVSVGQMPVINEDGNAIAMSTAPTTPPPAMLRVPAKNPRRSMGPPAEGEAAPYVVGFLAMPPGILTPVECKDEGDDGDEDTVVGQMTPTPPVRPGDRQWDGEGWKSNTMQRKCHVILVVAVIIVVLVGLAVGLTLGLTKTSDTNSQTGSRSALPSGLSTGAFAFDTVLQDSLTACTSSPSTWSCPSSKEGSPLRFNWTITESNSGYQVSSANDPIASSFSNIPLTLLDGDKEDERLTFSFKWDVSFEPPITTTNRAAKCTYTDTTFMATLWTKRGTQQPYSAVQRRMGYGNWTGLVEIAEIKNATLGVPECVDSQGNVIADVQAEMGTCACVYRTRGWK